MPITSASQLPEQFHGLPEKGKRIAVHIMNILEEQGMIGDGAVNKTLGILGQLFNKGVGQSWGQNTNKTASQFRSLLSIGQFIPGPIGVAANAANAGLTAKDEMGEQLGKTKEEAFNPNTMSKVSEHKENRMNKIMKFDPEWSRTKVAAVKQPMTNVELQAAKVAFVINMWSDLSKRDVPMALANYNGTDKVASVKLMSSRDFVQAFPKVADILGGLGSVLRPTMDAMVSKVLPIAATIGLAEGGRVMYDKYKKHRAYTQMMEQYPELTEAEPGRVDKLYGVISNYSPTVAHDPVGSGAMIKTMLNYPDALDISMIKGLMDLERGAPRSLPNVFLEGMANQAAGRAVAPDAVDIMDAKIKRLGQLYDSTNVNPESPTDNPEASRLRWTLDHTKL